jgi:hypothetical protein
MKKIALIAIAVLLSLVSFKYASAQEKVAAATKCTFSISPSSNTFPSGGGSGGVDITTQSGCGWPAKSNASWITLSAGSGTGNGSIQYVVGINNSHAKRTGTMTIAGKTFTVTEAGDPNLPIVFKLNPPPPEACLYAPYSYTVPAASGGLGDFHYQLDTGGFPPLGIVLAPSGTLSGTPTTPGKKTFKICAVDIGGYSNCVPASIMVSETPCCNTPKDVCNIISDYGSCSTVYSCTTPSGDGYYKAGDTYFCCAGTKTEMNCEQANNNIEQFCNAPLLCTSFTYSDWSACQPDGTQTRYIISESPPGCDDANSELSQFCKYKPIPIKGGTYSGTCTATGSSITCCTDGICTSTPAPPPVTVSFSFPIPPGILSSALKSKVCPILIEAEAEAGCTNPTCGLTSSTSNSFTISLSCTVPPEGGCTAETVNESCGFGLD